MVAGVIRSLVNARGLQLKRAMVLYESLLVSVFIYDMQGEGEVQNYGCTDGQPQRSAGYQENGKSSKCTDKGIVLSDEGGRLKD